MHTYKFSLLLFALLANVSIPVSRAIAQTTTPTPSLVSALTEVQDKVPLSLNSIVLFALADNPDVRMALARQKQADAASGKARAQFLPIIDFMAQGGREANYPAAGAVSGTASNFSHEVSVNVRQLIYDWNKTQSNLKQQKQLESSAKLDTQVNIEETMNTAIQSYLDILQFQKNLKEQTAFVERERKLVDTVKQTFEAGASNKAMMDYANSRLAAAEADNNTIRANLNDAISNLEYLTGPLPPFEAQNPDDLDPSRLDLSSYLKMAETQNTGVQLSQSDLKALAYKLEVSKKALYPTVNLLLNYDDKYNNGGKTYTDREAKALLQFNYRLYDGGERKNDIKLVRAQIEEGQINQEKVVKELNRLIKQTYNQITSSVESRKQTMKEIASSEALQVLNRQNFEQGSINVIELIEGEERLNTARLKLNGQNTELYLNTYRLLITAGLLEQNFFCGTCTDRPVAVN